MQEEKPIWKDQLKAYDFPSLGDKTEADVTIVGAGLAGIFTAYLLSRLPEQKKITLVEAGEILAEGATAYTTAFITQIIDTATADLLEVYGKNVTRKVLDSGRDAIDLIEKIVKEEKIECGFMRCPVYIYAAKPEQVKDLQAEKDAYDQLGVPAVLTEVNDQEFKNYGYLKIDGQAKFDPIEFAQALLELAVKNGVQVYANSEVKEIAGEGPYLVKTEKGLIESGKVVVATYQPFNNPKEVLLKKGMYLSYVFEASLDEKSQLEQALYWDLGNPYHYFRVDRNDGQTSVIIGGEDHKAWFKIDPDKSFEALEEYLGRTLGNNYKINRRWHGPILEPSDGLALIGQIRPDYYLASAFSGNGMTYSAISAMIFKDLVLGQENIYAGTYDPKRFNPKRWTKKAEDYFGELFGGVGKNIFSPK